MESKRANLGRRRRLPLLQWALLFATNRRRQVSRECPAAVLNKAWLSLLSETACKSQSNGGIIHNKEVGPTFMHLTNNLPEPETMNAKTRASNRSPVIDQAPHPPPPPLRSTRFRRQRRAHSSFPAPSLANFSSWSFNLVMVVVVVAVFLCFYSSGTAKRD